MVKSLNQLNFSFLSKKDYASDTAIAKSWKALSNALEVAYMVTIFGYSAPKSDAEAIAMLKKAWDEFIHTHHYKYATSFFDTTLGRCPRRSCEAKFDLLMNNNILHSNQGFKPDMDFTDIDKLTCDLIIEEQDKKGTRKMLSNPYKLKSNNR